MKRKVWDITVKDNPNRVVMGENDEFYTTDTEAFLVFNLQDEDFHPQSAMITLENRNDGSLKSEEVEVTDGDIQWEMPERYIEHSGNWQAQLVYEQMKDGIPEKYTSGVMTFTVNSHIKDKKKPSLVEIENWEKFIAEGTELIETWEDMEDLRQANEAQRQANYQELLDTGVLQTNINTKLEALEEEYAPKLNEVTTQLAQSANQLKPSWSVWEEFEQRQINVKWFGAKADGITDDKLAFQSAVDFAHSIGGATIFMPAGTYMIKSGIHWKSNVSLKGAGPGKSIFVVDGMFDGVIVELSQPSHGTGTNFLENCSFEDFEIDGSGFTYTDADIRGKGLFILYMRRARFRNLYLHDTVGTALGCDFLTETVIDSVVVERAGRLFSSTNTGGQSGIGIGTNALEDETVIVSNCHTIDCGNYGIFIESQNGDRPRSRHARIVNCVSKGNRFGIGNKGAGGALIMGCSVYDNTGSGIVLNEHSNGDQIIGNKIENNGDSGILVDGSYDGDLTISGNLIIGNNQHGIRMLDNLSESDKRNVSIANNQINDNGYTGIMTSGNLFGFIINGNEIFNNGQRDTFNLNMGIGIGGNNGQGVIDANLIYDNQETMTQVAGIKFTTASAINEDMTITNNNFAKYSRNVSLVLGDGQKNNFMLANNSGIIHEEFGTVTIPDGSTNVTINHSLRKVPTVVAVPSNAFGQIRVDGLSTLSFTIRRPLAENTGDLIVNWSAKVNPI